MKNLKLFFLATLITGFSVVSNAQPDKPTRGSASFEWLGELPCVEEEYLYGTITVEWMERMVEGKYTGHAKYYGELTGFPSERIYEVKQMNNDHDFFNKYFIGTHQMKLMITLDGKKVGMIIFVYHHNIDYTTDPWTWMNDIVLDEVKCF